MTETNDGFRIAEVDLELRGPGDFFGTRQSGLPEFRVADLLRDAAVLEEARADAMAIVQRDPRLLEPEHRELRAALLTRWRGKLDLASAADKGRICFVAPSLRRAPSRVHHRQLVR